MPAYGAHAILKGMRFGQRVLKGRIGALLLNDLPADIVGAHRLHDNIAGGGVVGVVGRIAVVAGERALVSLHMIALVGWHIFRIGNIAAHLAIEAKVKQMRPFLGDILLYAHRRLAEDQAAVLARLKPQPPAGDGMPRGVHKRNGAVHHRKLTPVFMLAWLLLGLRGITANASAGIVEVMRGGFLDVLRRCRGVVPFFPASHAAVARRGVVTKGVALFVERRILHGAIRVIDRRFLLVRAEVRLSALLADSVYENMRDILRAGEFFALVAPEAAFPTLFPDGYEGAVFVHPRIDGFKRFPLCGGVCLPFKNVLAGENGFVRQVGRGRHFAFSKREIGKQQHKRHDQRP